MFKDPYTSLVQTQPAAISFPAAWSRPAKSQTHRQDSLVEILWRQRRMMLIGAGITLTLGLIYLTLATRQYTSTARLIVSRGRPSLLNESHEAPVSEDDNFLATQREVVASNPVLALALASPGIEDLRTFSHEARRFDYLKKNLSVEVGKKVDLISISFEGRFPDEASKIVTSVVAAYIDYQSSQKRHSDQSAVAALELEKANCEADLAKKSADLLMFRTEHGITASGKDSTATDDGGMHALQSALITAHLNAVTAKVQSDQAQRQLASNPALAKHVNDLTLADGTDASAEDPALLKQELSVAKARARELERQYLPSHPYVQAAIKRVAELTIEQASALKAQVAADTAIESDLQKLYESEQQSQIQRNAAQTESDQMQADVTRLQQMIDASDRRMREIDLSSDDSAVTISILEPARTDDRPSKPQKSTSLAFSLVFGLAISAVLACIRDRKSRSLGSSSDVASILGVEVVGEMPAISTEISPAQRGQQSHLSPDSDLAHACRNLRSELLRAADTIPMKTLLIASPSAGDGRSTVASNLAISFAEGGLRVLLVDADFRSPMQDWIFGLEKVPGTAAPRRSNEGLGIKLASGIQHSGVDGLDVLTAYPDVEDPVRLLNDQAFTELLEKLSDEYDQIIVDSPSIDSGVEARILAGQCDACLLVLREGQTPQRTAREAVESLTSVGAEVLGVVINHRPEAGENRRDASNLSRNAHTARRHQFGGAGRREHRAPALVGIASIE